MPSYLHNVVSTTPARNSDHKGPYLANYNSDQMSGNLGYYGAERLILCLRLPQVVGGGFWFGLGVKIRAATP